MKSHHGNATSTITAYYLQNILMATVLFFMLSGLTKATTVNMATAFGNIEIELFDDTPITKNNFLSYIEKGAYRNSFIHRSLPGFVIQGGGFSYENNQFSEIEADPAIQNEFKHSNVRGTLAMAKLGGDPDSATSQWFFNLGDNSANLDAQNGGFTVFGQVIGDSMDVVDAIAELPTGDLTSFHGAFTHVPQDTRIAGPGFGSHLIMTNITVSNVPVPAAFYLFSSALIGIVGLSRKSA
jgi:cyclophilin family peptidyl-prolyl cis-trans isomerase